MLLLQLFSLLLVSFTLASPSKRKLDEASKSDKRSRTNSITSTSDSGESSDPFEEIESDDESHPTAPFSHGPIHDKIPRQGHYISYDRARKSPHWVSEHLVPIYQVS